MKKVGLFLSIPSCLGGLVAVLFLTACGPQNEFQAPPPPEVKVEVAEPKDVTAFLSFSGRTAARDFVEIRARVQGYLQSANFEAGQLVKEGQTLFQIDPKPFQAAVDAAKGEVASAQASLELTETTLARQDELFKKKAISELDFLNAKAERDKAAAQLEMAKAHLENTQIDLSYTNVKSPIDGRASRYEVSPGNLVGKSESTLLTTVVKLQPIEVYFEVDERQVVTFLSNTGSNEKLAGAGNQAQLEFANGMPYNEIGQVDFVDNRVDPNTGTIRLRAIFPNKEGVVLPGLFVRIQFPDEIEDAITVPQTALQRDLGGTFLLIADAENDVKVRYVETGAIIGDRIVITDKLKAGEKVIITNLQRARPGNKVAIEMVEPDPKPEEPSDPGDETKEAVSPTPSPTATATPEEN